MRKQESQFDIEDNRRYLDSVFEEWNGKSSLPSRCYTDDRLFELEMERIWKRQWLFACPECRVREPGEFFCLDFGKESVIVVRENSGKIAAHLNVCRHRGSRLCLETSGSLRHFTCPYHRWSYELDGKLRDAWLMNDEAKARAADLDLYSLPVIVIGGLVFVSFSKTPPMDQTSVDTVHEIIRIQGFAEAQVCATKYYDVRANWKIILENAAECYHCPVGHPEYSRSHYFGAVVANPDLQSEQVRMQKDMEDLWEEIGLPPSPINRNSAWINAYRIALRVGYQSHSLDGKLVAPLMGQLRDPNMGVLVCGSYPNFWSFASCDSAVLVQVYPISSILTKVRVDWLVEGNAVDGRDFNLECVTSLWRTTSEQDWRFCEANQLGVSSDFYRPSLLSQKHESLVQSFLKRYVTNMYA